MKFVIAGVALLVMLGIAGIAALMMMVGVAKAYEAMVSEAEPVLSRDSAYSYFREIAHGDEFGGADQGLRRWDSPIRAAVYGSPTDADIQTLGEVANDLQELTGLSITLVNESPNVSLYFYPTRAFSSIDPAYQPGNYGFFHVRHRAGVIHSARILIATDKINQQERNHVIREEFTQSLGLFNDSWSYPNSIFYQGWSTTQEFSDLDREIIRMLYGVRLKPHLTE